MGLLEGASSLHPASQVLSTDKQVVVTSRLPGVRQSSRALTIRSWKFYLKHHEDWVVRNGELWPRTGGGPLVVLAPTPPPWGCCFFPFLEKTHTHLS